jgi:glycosyltransferase involved in cell wall biosynthesis
MGIPRMAELHAPLVEERSRDGRNSLLSGYATRVETRNLISARRIRTVSSPLKANVVARGVPADRIVVQPNGVDADKFRPDSGVGDRIRRQHGLAGKTVFGFAGSFFKWHRIDSLIRGFALARPDCPDSALLIVGDGEGSRELRELAAELTSAESVVFTGNVPYAEMQGYYAAMDICCMAGTAWYCSPLKLLEYGAMRKAIIAPDTEAVRDIIEPERDGLMVPPGDDHAVATAMRALYADTALRDKLANAFHAKVLQQFTWDKVAANILRNLESIAGSGGGAA